MSTVFLVAAVVAITLYASQGDRAWAVAALAAVLLYSAAGRDERG